MRQWYLFISYVALAMNSEHIDRIIYHFGAGSHFFRLNFFVSNRRQPFRNTCTLVIHIVFTVPIAKISKQYRFYLKYFHTHLTSRVRAFLIWEHAIFAFWTATTYTNVSKVTNLMKSHTHICTHTHSEHIRTLLKL